MRSTKRIVRTDGTEEWLPAKAEGIKVKKGDVLYFNTWGGGGWGDALERDPQLVAADVRRRLVTSEGAKRYGVVVTSDKRVDSVATEALRAKMRAERGDDKSLFNFGGTVEELRERCEVETHLAAPTDPRVLLGA